MRYKTYTGIVLKTQPLQEADEVLTFWSWEQGKARLRARGVRRSTSKLRASLLPLAWVSLQVVPSEFLPVIINGRRLKNYSPLTSDLLSLAAVFHLFELVLKTTADRQPNPAISVLLRESLDYLEKTKAANLDFLIIFRLRLLAALGYGLSCGRCALCGLVLDGNRTPFVSEILLGLVCSPCQKKVKEARPLDLQVFHYLRKLEEKDFRFGVSSVTESVKAQAERLLLSFFQTLIERQINSSQFLAENMKVNPAYPVSL